MDDNNTTLIEGKIRPDDFQVGDFIPTKFGGYHEILDIEEDIDNPNQLKIKTRIVGTDTQYDKTWFRYNKNFDGVRRPNGVVDNITEEFPEVSAKYNTASWTFLQTLGGSNGAGLYEDKSGNKYVVKTPKSEKHAANEILASEFYEEAGIKTGRVYAGFNEDGETVLVSPFLEGSTTDFSSKLKDPAVLAEAQKGFAIDAWLNNYDSVGLEYDNMVMVGDVPVRVDPGGALLFRAQGKDKADQLTPEVTQIDSLRDSNTNAQAASVFGSMTDEQLAESAQLVANITPEKINELVDKHFYGDEETANFLKERLIARRENLVERFNLNKTSEQTTYEEAEQDQKDLGLQPATPSPQTVPTFTHESGTVILDPTGDLETQIQDAIASGSKVAFYYNDKERLVTPKNMWTNPKYGHVNLRATDEMDVEKNYTLDKIFKTFGQPASEDLGSPQPPAEEVLPSENLGEPQQPSDLDAGTPKPVNEVIAMGEVIKGEYPDAEVTVEDEYFRVTLDSGAMVTVLDQGNGKFEVIAYESWDEDGDSPVDVGSYNNLRDATNALRNTVKAIEAGQDADLPTAYPENSPISDIVAGVFDGTETEVPSLDEIVADVVADDPVKNPITDPNLIFESIKKQFPDNIELPNGDLVVRRKTVVKDGISYNYDTVVRRNANETFSVYIRETNLSDNSSRVFGYKRAVHSDQALKNQINI
jgi:hypothetical protein